MKTINFIYIVLILNFSVITIFSQEWVGSTLDNSQNSYYFSTADNGLACVGDYPNSTKIYKTTNRGISWICIKDFGNRTRWGNSMSFINSYTGWVYWGHSDMDDDPLTWHDELHKTTNGGNTWNIVQSFSNVRSYPKILFVSNDVGYIWESENKNLWKTTNGGNNWNVIWTSEHGDIFHVVKSEVDANVIYVAADAYVYERPYILKIYNTTITTIYDGNSDPYNLGKVKFLSSTIDNGTDYLKLCGDLGIAEINMGNNNVTRLSDNPLSSTYGFQFSDPYFGVIRNSQYIYTTFNRGATWSQEANNISAYGGNTVNIGNVVYCPGYDNNFLTRKFPMDLNTNFEWQGGTQFNMTVDGTNYNTPSSPNLQGGTMSLHATPVNTQWIGGFLDTIARFYYWGGISNGSMDENNTVYSIYQGNDINADYKSRLKTNVSNAFYNNAQGKVLKDANGVTNVIYESMQGIFFTRTRSDGHYKCEEIVSCIGYKTYNNSNPYLAEIKPWQGSDVVNSEENVSTVWEQRNGNNIVIYCRSRSPLGGGNFSWNLENSFTITNAPSEFKAYPKLIMVKHPTSNGGTHYFYVITFLRPTTGSNSELVARAYYYTGQGEKYLETVIEPANITTYGITGNLYSASPAAFDIHFAYVKNGRLAYKHSRIYYESLLNQIKEEPWSGSYDDHRDLSELDVLQDRGEIDISLRNSLNNPGSVNLQPVVVYKGRYTVHVAVNENDAVSSGNNTEPNYVSVQRYPIVYRERLSSGQWSSQNGWYNDGDYKDNPGIEGSKLYNSYLINYEKNNSVMVQKVTKWKGNFNSYYMNSFVGSDAKFVRNSLINEGGVNPSVSLLTLSSGSAPYNININSYNINNTPNETDPYPDEVDGVLISGDCQYSFNLGSIMVNSQLINFYPDADSLIDSVEQLNDNMKSRTFGLQSNDTLIIGRNCFYLEQDEQNPFTEVLYSVILMNKTTENPFMTLVQDTIQVRDSIQIEYLDGFVIYDIPLGFDSFYVQMRIDTLRDGGGDATGDRFGMNLVKGGFGIGESGGDNPLGNRYINWHNKITGNNNNLPTVFNLYQNFPNPFNPITTIKYDIPKNSNVTMIVYDLLGREVTRLVNNEFKQAGRYEIKWPAPSGNANNFASGVYIYRLQAGDFVSVKKMVLVK